jgi:hypothetical protein
MAKDIPIDSGSDFTADVVKAVEAIAQNIKNSSTAFTGNFDKVSNSIKTMQKAVVTSVKQIKLVAPVNKKDVKKEETKDLTSEFSRIVDAIQNIKLVSPVEKQIKKEPEKKKSKSENKKDTIKEKESKAVKPKDPINYTKPISSGFKSIITAIATSTKQVISAISKIKLGKESKESVKESSEKSSKESIKESKKESVKESKKESVKESKKESVKESSKESVNKSIKEKSSKELIKDKSVKESIKDKSVKESKETIKESSKESKNKSKDYSKDISSGFKSVTTSVKDMTKEIVASVGKIKLDVGKPEKSKAEKKKETEGKANFAEDISSGFASIVTSVYEASILITNAVLEIGTEIVNELTKTKKQPKKETQEKSGPDFTPDSSMSEKEKSVIKKEGYKDKSNKEQPKAKGISIAKAVIEIQQAIIVLGKGKEEDKKKDKKKDVSTGKDKKKDVSTGKDNSIKSIFEDVKSTISSFMKGNKAEGIKKAKGIVGNVIQNKTSSLMGGGKSSPKMGIKSGVGAAGGIGGKIGGPALALLGAGISKLMQGAGIAATAIKKHGIELAKKIPGADRIIKGSLVDGKGNKAAKKVGSKIGGSVGAEAAGAAAAGLGMALNSVTGAVGIASGAIGMFGSYIEKSNPALMEQFGIILNDLGGVIGRSLAPVIQTLLPLFRQFADYIDYAMKLIQPSIDVVINAFKALAGPLMEAGATILKVFAPVLVFAAKILEGLVIIVTPLIDAFSEFLEIIGEMFTSFFEGVGITEIMMNGFKLMSDAVKILVGAIGWASGAFYQVIGAAIKGIGTLIDWIPGTGDLGKTLMKMGEDADKAGAKLRESGADMISSGLTGKERDKKPPKIKPNASIGAGVKEAQEVSISGIGDDIRKSAMMAGQGQKTQEQALNDISKNLEKNNLAAAVAQGMIEAQTKMGDKPQGFKNDTEYSGSGGSFEAPS